jgi:hypothetical protein
MKKLHEWWRALIEWADRDLMPGPAPAVGMVTGFVVMSWRWALPWALVLLLVLLLAFLGRFTKAFDRKMEGWHIEMALGAGAAEWFYFMLQGHP